MRAGSAGSALTTFNKGNVNLSPKIIAHRSSATRHEMLVNPPAYSQFCHKAYINDHVRALANAIHHVQLLWPCACHVLSVLCAT